MSCFQHLNFLFDRGMKHTNQISEVIRRTSIALCVMFVLAKGEFLSFKFFSLPMTTITQFPEHFSFGKNRLSLSVQFINFGGARITCSLPNQNMFKHSFYFIHRIKFIYFYFDELHEKLSLQQKKIRPVTT